jgi:hypothetical protein
VFDAATELGPLDLSAHHVTEANTFRLGELVAFTAAGIVLADNTDADKVANGIVMSASPTDFRLITSAGQAVKVPSHGLGVAGQELWLGTSGGVVTSPPSGGPVRVTQYVLLVIDDDNLILFPQEPFSI